MNESRSEIEIAIKKTKKRSINSLKLNIFKLFEKKNVFKIKEFQRKYEWKKFQILELIEEINENDSKKDYFLGMIILKKELFDKNEKILNIVDGQQRITTLFLILKAIEENLKSERNPNEFENIIEEIKNVYILTEKNNSRLKISDIRGYEELENILIKGHFNNSDFDSETNNEQNPIYTIPFQQINNYISNMGIEKIKLFYEKMKKISFSIVILGPAINEYKVFEDLNSKGVDLKIDDLLRNFFAQKAVLLIDDNKEINKSAQYVNMFEKLLSDVEVFLKKEKKEDRALFSAQIGRWFKNYILYKSDSKKTLADTNDKRMYLLYRKELSGKITKINELIDEINSIGEFLDFCKWINKEKDNATFLINDIEVYPTFFAFYKAAKKNDVDLIKLKNIFVIIYLLIICQPSTIKDFNKKFLENIKIIFNVTNNFDEALKKIFKFVNQTENLIKGSIIQKITEDTSIFKDKKMKRFSMFFLAKMIEHKYKENINLMSDKYDIEHIFPQNPDLVKLPDEDKKDLTFLLYNSDKLKNLTLIEKELNTKLGNKFFGEKRKIFLDDPKKYLKSTADVFKYEKYGKAEMEERFSEMQKFADEFVKLIWNMQINLEV